MARSQGISCGDGRPALARPGNVLFVKMMTESDIKLPITAIVVMLNEDRRLRACLSSISFCDELIVCDLGSTDELVKIAKEFGATILRRERVPVVEMLWPELFGLAGNSWVLRFDPDGEFPVGLVHPLKSIILTPNKIGCVSFPLQNCFW